MDERNGNIIHTAHNSSFKSNYLLMLSLENERDERRKHSTYTESVFFAGFTFSPRSENIKRKLSLSPSHSSFIRLRIFGDEMK